MTPTLESQALAATTLPDGFDVLDVCHRQTLLALGKLAALVSSLIKNGPDADSRGLAREVVEHFSTIARVHHEDEERHLFPRLLRNGDTAKVGSARRQPRPSSQTSAQACASDWRTTSWRVTGLTSPP